MKLLNNTGLICINYLCGIFAILSLNCKHKNIYKEHLQRTSTKNIYKEHLIMTSISTQLMNSICRTTLYKYMIKIMLIITDLIFLPIVTL